MPTDVLSKELCSQRQNKTYEIFLTNFFCTTMFIEIKSYKYKRTSGSRGMVWIDTLHLIFIEILMALEIVANISDG